jgi:hypothetical protein
VIDHNAVILDLETKRDAINTTIGLLRELYGMPATNGHKDPPPPAPTKRVYKKRAGVAPAESMVDPSTGRQSPLQDAILQVLIRPMTSIETFEGVKKSGYQTTSGSVYSTLRLLLHRGLITKGQNDIGTTTWKLT